MLAIELAATVASTLGDFFSSVISAAGDKAGQTLYEVVARGMWAREHGSELDAYKAKPLSVDARKAFVAALTADLAADHDFHSSVAKLVTGVPLAVSSDRSSNTAIASGGSTSMAGDNNVANSNNTSKGDTNTGGVVVAVFAVIVIIAVLFLGKGVYTLVASGIDKVSVGTTLTGDSTCSDFIASSDQEAKTGIMKQLYLELNQPKVAADPFIIQNTEYQCGSNPRTTLRSMARAISRAP